MNTTFFPPCFSELEWETLAGGFHLPTHKEVRGVLDNYESRIATLTGEKKAVAWWLADQGTLGATYLAFVGEEGRVYTRGANPSTGAIGVRPAVWVTIDQE